MIPASEALELILANVGPLSAEEAPLADAAGRVLAADLRAREDLPPFDNSAMDGFAARAQDLARAAPESPVALKVLDSVRAGQAGSAALARGEAVKIMTGAPVPAGADAVIMKEATREEGGSVLVLQAPEPGENVRPRGEDVRAGLPLLAAGTLLRPYEIALLAAQGFRAVLVARRPRVAVLATGDELYDGEGSPPPGRIRNSNGPALACALARWGADAIDLGAAPDDRGALQSRLRQALDVSDMLVVTGGVSVGDYDLTRPLLKELGAREVFWRVAIKPGKPLFFGLSPDGKPVFGLPGNPVAALVCLEEFVRPALERLQGRAPAHPSYHLRGRAVNDYPKPAGQRQYLFCRGSAGPGGFTLEIIRPQGSAMLGMACRADALAVAPAGPRRVQAGDDLPFRWLK